MSRYFSISLLMAAVGVLLIWPGVPLSAESSTGDQLSVRADYWYPLNGNPDSEQPGFAIEILESVYADADVEIDYRLADWSRSLEMVRDGRIDCVVGVYRSEAPDLAYPETPLAWDIAAFYVPVESDWQYRGLESLDGVTLGLIAGYGYGEVLDDYIARHRSGDNLRYMHGLEPLRRNLKKLMRGRVDVLVESPFVMESMLKRMGLDDQVREAGRVGKRTPLYLACNPDMRDVDAVLGIFDRGMGALRDNGQLKKILEAYRVSENVVGPATEADGAD